MPHGSMRSTQGALGFVQRGDEILVRRPDERLGQTDDPGPVHVDAVGDGSDLCCGNGAHPNSLAALGRNDKAFASGAGRSVA